MVLIYDNSNPITGSLLSVARTAAEFNYGQARVPRHRGLRLPASTLSSCLREFGGSAESMWRGGGGGSLAPWWRHHSAPCSFSYTPQGTWQRQLVDDEARGAWLCWARQQCAACTVPGTGVGCPGMAGGRAAQGPAGGWIERQREGPGSAFLAGTKPRAPTQCFTEPDPEFKVFLSNGEVSANLDFMRSCLKIIIIKKTQLSWGDLRPQSSS